MQFEDGHPEACGPFQMEWPIYRKRMYRIHILYNVNDKMHNGTLKQSCLLSVATLHCSQFINDEFCDAGSTAKRILVCFWGKKNDTNLSSQKKR